MLYRAPNRNARTKKKLQARSLRRECTASEDALWKILRGNGVHRFQRQKVIGGWIFDFWCWRERVVVELDGSRHDYSLNDKKDRFLSTLGIRVLRIPSHKVFAPGFEEWFWKELFYVIANLSEESKTSLRNRPQ